jgi:hypothetical protein
MSRTIKDIPIQGRSIEDINVIIQEWIEKNNFKVIKNDGRSMRIRKGLVFITVPKYFDISYEEISDKIVVHIEGYIKASYLYELDFRENFCFGYIPRNEGFQLMENLCLRLDAISEKFEIYKP